MNQKELFWFIFVLPLSLPVARVAAFPLWLFIYAFVSEDGKPWVVLRSFIISGIASLLAREDGFKCTGEGGAVESELGLALD